MRETPEQLSRLVYSWRHPLLRQLFLHQSPPQQGLKVSLCLWLASVLYSEPHVRCGWATNTQHPQQTTDNSSEKAKRCFGMALLTRLNVNKWFENSNLFVTAKAIEPFHHDEVVFVWEDIQNGDDRLKIKKMFFLTKATDDVKILYLRHKRAIFSFVDNFDTEMLHTCSDRNRYSPDWFS